MQGESIRGILVTLKKKKKKSDSIFPGSFLAFTLLQILQSRWKILVKASLIVQLASLVVQPVKKKAAFNAGDPGLILGSGRSPGEGIGYPLQYSWASLVAQLVKNPPAMQETWFDPWVGKMPWRIPWTVQSRGSQRVRHDWATFREAAVMFDNDVAVRTVLDSGYCGDGRTGSG